MSENENKIVEEAVEETTPAPEQVNTENTAPDSNTVISDYGYTDVNGATPTPTPAIKELPPENIVAGTVGALLFSLVGAVLYFIIYQIGYIAGICGLITVVCAIKGYAFFGKRESVKGIVIAIAISVVMLLVAEYISIAYTIYNDFNALYEAGQLEFKITLADAIRGTMSYILEFPEMMSAVIRDVLIMLALSAVGAFSSVKNAIIAAKVNNRNLQ